MMKIKIHKIITSLVFLTGALLHLTAITFGKPYLQEYILTPLFDVFFGLVMAYAGIAGIIYFKNYIRNSLFQSIIFWISLVYLCISIPLHIKVAYTWDTAYVQNFPMWFSWVIIPIQLLLATFWVTLKINLQPNK